MPGRDEARYLVSGGLAYPDDLTSTSIRAMYSKTLFIITFLSFIGVSVALHAQDAHRLSGFVLDHQGERIAGALVWTDNGGSAVTDRLGRFALLLDEAKSTRIYVRYLGYELWERNIHAPLTDTVLVRLTPLAYNLQGVELIGTWAEADGPFTSTQIRKEELASRNMGQDIPWLLRFSPGVVASSDAGTGIGYTGIRVRGSDPTRINVTINGVPVNDSESQAVFWVNMPDLASSVDQIQIQRGVGTSTNGAGAFGATINLQTQRLRTEPYGELQLHGGSFNTRRMTAAFGTGTIGKYWSFDGRFSRLQSDGYIDRATADLRSWYGALTWHRGRSMVKLTAFSGEERTYQAWWGTPQSRLENDVEGMLAHAARNGFTEAQTENLLNAGRTYNYYEYPDEVDQYAQTHIHLNATHDFDSPWRVNATLHYTRGAGFFEQFRHNERISRYGLEPVVIGGQAISRWDVVRRRWLDNHFGGGIAQVRYDVDRFSMQAGGGWNLYTGDHFGRIIWASVATNIGPNHPYYFGDARKTDGNVYVKGQWQWRKHLQVFGDLQYRQVAYRTAGTENNLRSYDVDVAFPFFNPKAGLTWQMSPGWQVYSSLAVGHREPIRRDFVDAPEGFSPRPERMINVEAGWRYRGTHVEWAGNLYLMDYYDQLVPTGALNDVGASLLTNVPRSYRAGVELTAAASLIHRLSYQGSLALSQNRIRRFEEILYDYTGEVREVRVEHKDVAIAFSPAVVYNHQLQWMITDRWSVAWLSQYVGRQYLDNTQDDGRVLPAWWVQDMVIRWDAPRAAWGELSVRLQINNALDYMYSTNGYTYSYFFEGLITENFFYPQAGRHFLGGLSLRF
jgi:iron complex outermembrane receptor protein